MKQNNVKSIINAYGSIIIKLYCRIRFIILHQSFLDEIGQYFPSTGHVIDFGCGFGLFSLYYAKKFPKLKIVGIDINPKRIILAKEAARKMSLQNVKYEVGDASSYNCNNGIDVVYMLDIIHHIPIKAVKPLLKQIFENLNDGGRLIIKDVGTKPAYKRWFTYFLDKAMDLKAGIHYWEREEFIYTLKEVGFEVFSHSMTDILPYPHILYVCRKFSN